MAARIIFAPALVVLCVLCDSVVRLGAHHPALCRATFADAAGHAAVHPAAAVNRAGCPAADPFAANPLVVVDVAAADRAALAAVRPDAHAAITHGAAAGTPLRAICHHSSTAITITQTTNTA